MALNICKIIIIARELQISWWRTQKENLDAKAVRIVTHYLRISIYACLYISSVQLCRWILYGRFFDPVSKARVRLRVNYIIPEFFFLLLKDQNQNLAPKNSKKKKKKKKKNPRPCSTFFTPTFHTHRIIHAATTTNNNEFLTRRRI